MDFMGFIWICSGYFFGEKHRYFYGYSYGVIIP